MDPDFSLALDRFAYEVGRLSATQTELAELAEEILDYIKAARKEETESEMPS